MKFAIIPALSALLLAGMPAHADTSFPSALRVAQNASGDDKPGKRGDQEKPAEIHATPAALQLGMPVAGRAAPGKAAAPRAAGSQAVALRPAVDIAERQAAGF